MTFPPLCTELPYYADNAIYFECLRSKPWPAFLDCGAQQHIDARFDILTAEPFITLMTVGENTLITYSSGESQLSSDDPFTLLRNILQRYPVTNCSDLPFCGGALGYLSYDLGRRLETLPHLAHDAEHIPSMALGIYDWAIVSDHLQQKCWLVSYGLNTNTHTIWSTLVEQLKHASLPSQPATFQITSPLRQNFDYTQYQQAFDKIKNYIREGDCYQVNLAKRFEVDAQGDPWAAYQYLRAQNSAPFSAYFSTPHVAVLSSSPERLLKVNEGCVETKPIKGTRPRNINDPIQDKALADELQSSLKDRAENLMIVDLLRNDLGRVCKPGSISVPKPFQLESFTTVHHLVSTITGILADEHDAVSLLRACFPGGSITGAPKLRAMEIIEELEPHQRGIYCGSIAYIGFDGKMDSNITIRTLIYSQNRLRFWAGGGIVADSQVDAEYQEIEDKAAAMLHLIKQFSLNPG